MNRFIYIVSILFLLVGFKSGAQSDLSITSPNERIKYFLEIDSKGNVSYSVSKDGFEFIQNSKIGFAFSSGEFSSNLKVEKISSGYEQGDFEMPIGKSSICRFAYNENEYTLKENSGAKRNLRLIVRVYDNGVAFRYLFNEEMLASKESIYAELTEFNFTNDFSCWAQHLPHFNFNYEKGFDHTTISGIYGQSSFSDPVMQYIDCYNFPAAHNSQKLVGLPLLVDLDSHGYMAIAEADLKDYPGMYLRKDQQDSLLMRVALSPLRNNSGVCVKLEQTMETPWRVIMLADDPGGLIESNLLLSLNRPCKIEDTSWIKPGISTWDFLSRGRVAQKLNLKDGVNMEAFKFYIDFASEYNLDYFTIDEGWCPGTVWYRETPSLNQLKWAEGIKVDELVDYANKRNIGLFLWARWDNIRDDMENIFETFEKWGIKGVKIDFMDSDDQWMVNWYEKCLATAAKYHLMINFHGAFKPTGLIRTYPNYITQEGVKGLEWSNTTNTLNSTHNVNLAFTRMLLGPVDYTPVGYNNVSDEEYTYSSRSVMTTRAHQLALTVLYESGLVTIAEAPHILKMNQESDILKRIPASWDETRFIDGKPDEYVVLARRKGDEWFISGINNGTPREIEFPISFIEDRDKMQIELYKDSSDADSNPKSVTIESKALINNDILRFRLAKNGGFIAHIR